MNSLNVLISLGLLISNLFAPVGLRADFRVERAAGPAGAEPRVERAAGAESRIAGVAGAANFEISVESEIAEATFPLDRWIKRSVEIKNTGESYLELDYWGYRIDPAGKHPLNLFPQGPFLMLEPGEIQQIWTYDDEFVHLPYGDQRHDHQVFVSPRGKKEEAKSVEFTNIIHVVKPEKIKNEAVIFGYLYEKETKRKISGAEIRLRGVGGYLNFSARPEINGFYRIELPAAEYWLEASAPGSENFYQRIKLEAGKTKINVVMERMEPGAEGQEPWPESQEPWAGGQESWAEGQEPRAWDQEPRASAPFELAPGASAPFELTKKLEIDYGVFRGDSSRDEKFFALAPGYSYAKQPKDQKPPEVKTFVYLFDINGNTIFKYPVNNEVWGLDLSDDGSYIAASTLAWRDAKNQVVEEILLLNQKGRLLWKYKIPPGEVESREVRISHNSQYLAAGTGAGYVYLFDLKTGQVLWKNFTAGQVRAIRFFEDDSKILAGSGSGYLYLYDLEGNLIWKSYIGSWPYTYGLTISPSGKYIATAGKLGEVYLINSADGRALFHYEMQGGGSWVEFAPDESYFLAGSRGSEGTVIFDLEGNPLWSTFFSDTGKISSDGKSILVSGEKLTLFTSKGTKLWSYETGVFTKFAYLTSDQTKIIAADQNGYVYFFEKTVK